MPRLIRRLAREDFRGGAGPRATRVDLGPYRGFLEGLNIGEGGVLALEGEETPRVVKRRLSMAAGERNLGVRWLTYEAGQLRFRLTAQQERPEATPPAETPRPRGRPGGAPRRRAPRGWGGTAPTDERGRHLPLQPRRGEGERRRGDRREYASAFLADGIFGPSPLYGGHPAPRATLAGSGSSGGQVALGPVGVLLDADSTRRTLREPDLCFVSTTRSHIITTKAVEGVPDLIIEVLSPNDIQS